MALAAVALLTLFLFPMWRITLVAPQYPGGVTMYIYINKLGGDSPGTLQNVNILNHYVGMKKIEPESIPELKYFPYVVLGMVVLGLIGVFVNRSWYFLGWGILMALLAAVGLYDFYLWEYDYGHNLSPMAPIKIPGASFQPPLLGTKVILNFIATSLPHVGGYFAAGAIVLALVAGWLKGKIERNHETVSALPGKRRSAGILRTVA